MWEVFSSTRNSICLLALHDEEDNRDLPGPHRHNWLNADGQGVDARDTWHFEVEVLRIYGRQELWSHGFGARPVSDGPYQPVDAADVRRRVAFGVHQDNEFTVRHCCVYSQAGLL